MTSDKIDCMVFRTKLANGLLSRYLSKLIRDKLGVKGVDIHVNGLNVEHDQGMINVTASFNASMSAASLSTILATKFDI